MPRSQDSSGDYQSAAAIFSGRSRRRDLFVAIVLFAFLLRLLLLYATRETALMVVDEQHYHALATNVAQGHGFAWEPGRLTSQRPPLFLATMAVVWKLAGLQSLIVVRLFQIVLTLLTALVLFRLGLRLYGREVARLAAASFLLFPTFVAFDFLLLTETLFTFLLISTIYAYSVLLQTRSAAAGVLAGALLGLSALTRGVLWTSPLLLAPFVFFATTGERSRRVGLSLIFALSCAVVVAPWAVRNTKLQGVFTVVDTMGGIALRMGNAETTPPDRAWDPMTLSGETSAFRAMAEEHPESAHWTEGQREKWALRAAVTYMVQNPLVTLRRAIVKFANFWGLDRVVLAGWQQGLYQPPMWSVLPAAATIVLADAAAMAIGLLGLILAPPADRKVHVAPILIIVFLCGMHTLAFGHSRYRLPIMPILLLYAAAAVHQRSWQLLATGGKAWLAILAGIGLLVTWSREVFLVDSDKIHALIEKIMG